MIILLTGHKGFLGTKLQQHLNNNGHVTIGLDKTEGEDLLNCNLTWDCDLVIHLAGESGVRKSIENPHLYLSLIHI